MTAEKTITEEKIFAFSRQLSEEELSSGSVAQYARALRHLAAFLDGPAASKKHGPVGAADRAEKRTV